MNTVVETKSGAKERPADYWRLWLLDAALVSAGLLFFLATRYGSPDFLGKALAMAVLPFIAMMILAGGGGSTVFALTKIMIAKRGLNKPAALALLVGPGVVVTLALVLLAQWHLTNRRLSYICLGNPPVTASHVEVTGYSTFLNAEWLAVFQVDTNGFQALVDQAQLVPIDDFEFRNMLGRSSLKHTRLFQSISQPSNSVCFERVFNERTEHQRGCIYATYDAATSTAVVLREYHD